MTPAWLDEETRALLTLQLLPGLGPRLTAALLGRFGSATRVLAASAVELAEVPRLSVSLAERIVAALRHCDVAAEVELMQAHGVQAVRQDHPAYPPLLQAIPDPPAVLYVKGALLGQDQRAVAIVGARSCTPYGKRMAERLAQGLARAGYTVVSGLARGIDAVAHRAALAVGGRTVAVLAGGLARIYPPEHADLAEEVARAGALLSESPMRLEPLPQMFPQRNRLISGMALGVVVVEAGERSGALLTAHHAAEQGREVFAVPGPADSDASVGTLKLLRHGATLIRHAEDVLEALEGLPTAAADRKQKQVAEPNRVVEPASRQQSPGTPPRNPPPLTEAQQRLLAAWQEEPLCHADDLVARSGLSVAEASQALLQLEMHGLVRRLPGNRYERRSL